MKKISGFLFGLFFLLFLAGSANADLITIGTAKFTGNETPYNLIWDNDDGLVWLDYTQPEKLWQYASELPSLQSYTINSAYTVNSIFNWRLPTAVASQETINHESGSELGHLFYGELNLKEGLTTDAALNASNFENLIASTYWTSTEAIDTTLIDEDAWAFEMNYGLLRRDGTYNYHYGLFLSEADVSTVPEPATMLLFGLGLLGVAGVGRKKK